MRLKLLRKEEQLKYGIWNNETEYGTMKQICLCFPNRQRLTGFTIENPIKFCSRKSILSIYLIIFTLVIFSMKFYRTI